MTQINFLNIKDFLTKENIPFLPFYYFLQEKEDGTLLKKPIKEKNNLTIEEITNESKLRQKMTKPKSYWIKDEGTYKEIPLKKNELKTLTNSYTIFIKHHPEYYCIDIDDKNIKSMDDFLNEFQKHNPDNSLDNPNYDAYDIIKKCAWAKGNTKGIHIYIKLKNVPEYTNQQGILNMCEGDFIKINNMWEGVDKEIYNYGNYNEAFDCKRLKCLFKKNTLWKEPKEEKEKAKEEKPNKIETKKEDIKIDNNELKNYINLCIINEVFNKVNGYKNWLNIGFLIKNSLGDDGFDLFNKVSQEMPKYDGLEETQRFYNDLNKRIFNQDKKQITIGSLKMIIKEADEEKYKIINNDMKQLIKGSNNNYNFDEQKCLNFNTEYFNILKSYEEKKQYFEKFVCKVLRPQPLYIYSENDNNNYNCLLYSENDIKETFKHLSSSIIKKEKESKFISEWIDDNNIKLYNRMDFNPYNGIRNDKIKSDCYNLFNGYNKQILTEYDINKKEEILKPFKELLFELCGGANEIESYDYFYKFLAHLIQKPAERIPICFIFKSKQGVGKNVMLDVIGSIIGKAHYITSSNPKDFFGDYAEGFYRKILVNINECEGKDTFDYEGKIKSFITENSITLNPKFVRQTTISNYARLIIFTNKPNPIPIDVRSKDRRFVVYQSTDKYLDKKYGTTFWEKLVKYFQNPKFIACLYDDLNNIKLDGIKWKESRPITKAYLEMCKLYIPTEALFLEDFIDNKKYNNNNNSNLDLDDDEDFIDNLNNSVDISTTDLYKQYTEFCKKYGYINDNSYQPNITKFNGRLQELDLQIIRQKTSETTIFRFTPQTVYKIMEQRKWIIKKETEIDEDELKDIGGEDFDNYFVEL